METRDNRVNPDWKVLLVSKEELVHRDLQENQLEKEKLVFLDSLVQLVEMDFPVLVDSPASLDHKERLEKMA
jgi:hypothetical protein